MIDHRARILIKFKMPLNDEAAVAVVVCDVKLDMLW